MKILIVRHGEPDYENDTLTEKGWREAGFLSERLSSLKISACYVSPLGRARDTASFTLKELGLAAKELDWLREFSIPIHKPNVPGESIPWDWLPQDWTREERFYHYDQWLDAQAMASSAIAPAYDRVTGSLDQLLEAHGYVRRGRCYEARRANEDTIILFCHFGLECVLLSHLLNISPMVLWHGTCALPSSVTTLATEERREGLAIFRMIGFGDISHLYAHREPPSFSARFCETYGNPNERHD